jgi:hypothetical protein
MIKFRWHRGSLEESMATAMEFDSLMELFIYITNNYVVKNCTCYIEDFTLVYYSVDHKTIQDIFGIARNGEAVGFIFEEIE